MILAVVGDLDVTTTEKLIADTFTSLRARTPEPKTPVIAQPADFGTNNLHVFSNTQTTTPQIHTTLITAIARPAADTAARRADGPRHCVA